MLLASFLVLRLQFLTVLEQSVEHVVGEVGGLRDDLRLVILVFAVLS